MLAKTRRTCCCTLFVVRQQFSRGRRFFFGWKNTLCSSTRPLPDANPAYRVRQKNCSWNMANAFYTLFAICCFFIVLPLFHWCLWIVYRGLKNCANEVDHVWVTLKGYTIYCANEGIDVQYYCAMYLSLSDMQAGQLAAITVHNFCYRFCWLFFKGGKSGEVIWICELWINHSVFLLSWPAWKVKKFYKIVTKILVSGLQHMWGKERILYTLPEQNTHLPRNWRNSAQYTLHTVQYSCICAINV